jgi:flagellar hook assembly protein FlgD
MGQRVRTLVDGTMDSGVHSVVWDGRDGLGRKVGAGVYLLQMEAGDFVEVRKMVLIR